MFYRSTSKQLDQGMKSLCLQDSTCNGTLKAIGKISNDKLIMRNKLNEEAECICIGFQFSYFTLGVILVVIGIISLPIQIKVICRELLLRLNFIQGRYQEIAKKHVK